MTVNVLIVNSLIFILSTLFSREGVLLLQDPSSPLDKIYLPYLPSPALPLTQETLPPCPSCILLPAGSIRVGVGKPGWATSPAGCFAGQKKGITST